MHCKTFATGYIILLLHTTGGIQYGKDLLESTIYSKIAMHILIENKVYIIDVAAMNKVCDGVYLDAGKVLTKVAKQPILFFNY